MHEKELHLKVLAFGPRGRQHHRLEVTPMRGDWPAVRSRLLALLAPGTTDGVVEYVDSSNDVIVIESPEEWAECVGSLPYTKDNPLGLTVRDPGWRLQQPDLEGKVTPVLIGDPPTGPDSWLDGVWSNSRGEEVTLVAHRGTVSHGSTQGTFPIHVINRFAFKVTHGLGPAMFVYSPLTGVLTELSNCTLTEWVRTSPAPRPAVAETVAPINFDSWLSGTWTNDRDHSLLVASSSTVAHSNRSGVYPIFPLNSQSFKVKHAWGYAVFTLDSDATIMHEFCDIYTEWHRA